MQPGSSTCISSSSSEQGDDVPFADWDQMDQIWAEAWQATAAELLRERTLERVARGFVAKKADYVERCHRVCSKSTDFCLRTAKCQQARSMLFMSVILGDPAYVMYCCREGCGLDVRNVHGETALHIASIYGQVEIVRILCQGGVDLNCLDSTGHTPLARVVHHRPDAAIDIIRCLLEFGSDVNKAGHPFIGTPLHIAADHGDVDIVELLCKSGAEIDKVTGDRATSLHRACGKGHLQVVRYLLRMRADMTRTMDDSQTPLSYSQHWDRCQVTQFLLERSMMVA